MSKFNKLSRAEMKNVMGGFVMSCHCQCNGAGTWDAQYANEASALYALGQNCSMGGSCTCTQPAGPIS